MKHFLAAFLILIAGIIAAPVAQAEPVDDIYLGRVNLRKLTNLDKKARADVAALAAKIKKQRSSVVVKLRGDFHGAENAEEYLAQSVFLAREVEKHLATLLTAKFQIFVTASKYRGEKSTGENSVEIFLYPSLSKLEEMESLRFISSQTSPLPEAVAEAVRPAPETVRSAPATTRPVTETAKPVSAPARPEEKAIEGGLLSRPLEDTIPSDAASKREPETLRTEDPVLANDLVNKAKARAAEKAKRRASEN